jgi:uncharacterized membrane-anchored protein
MSREGAERKIDSTPTGGTPIWVWIVYGLGILAATIFVLSVLFVLGAYIASDDAPVTYDVSTLAVALWGGLILLAVVTWFARRRGGRR